MWHGILATFSPKFSTAGRVTFPESEFSMLFDHELLDPPHALAAPKHGTVSSSVMFQVQILFLPHNSSSKGRIQYQTLFSVFFALLYPFKNTFHSDTVETWYQVIAY